jgi:hypothetical protein
MDSQVGIRSPQLKKIKRPINRAVPQTESRTEQKEINPFTVSKTPVEPVDRLNSYLDEQSLPTKQYQENRFVPSEKINATRLVDDAEYTDDVYEEGYSNSPDWLNTKVFILVACLTLFIGIVAGKFLFGESKVVRNGLQGVVVNTEVPRGRARCGIAERTQGCVLYIMNPQRQEMNARDFYDLASQLSGRQRFVIETGNMRYSNTKIRPGEIVQLNIPPL